MIELARGNYQFQPTPDLSKLRKSIPKPRKKRMWIKRKIVDELREHVKELEGIYDAQQQAIRERNQAREQLSDAVVQVGLLEEQVTTLTNALEDLRVKHAEALKVLQS